MAWIDTWYNGTVTEITMQQSSIGRGSARYGVYGENDFSLTLTASLTGSLSGGTGWAYGITSTTTDLSPVTFGSVASGTRWDTVVIRRDSTPPGGGTTSVMVLPGGSSQVISLNRLDNPGTTTDQPLWLVPVTPAGAGNPVDIRAWYADGGLMGATDGVKDYLDDIGTYIHILATSLSWRRKRIDGALAWVVENTGPAGPTPNLTVGSVTTGAAGSPASATLTGTSTAPVLNLTIPQGAQGVAASAITLKGTVASSSALPTTGNTANDAWVTSDTEHLWAWISGAWQDLGPFQGPKGDPGAPGTTDYTQLINVPLTFTPIIGTTATTAKAGNWVPAVADVTGLSTALTAKVETVLVSTGSEARPTGTTTVIWKGGTTRPTNIAAGDIWLKATA